MTTNTPNRAFQLNIFIREFKSNPHSMIEQTAHRSNTASASTTKRSKLKYRKSFTQKTNKTSIV